MRFFSPIVSLLSEKFGARFKNYEIRRSLLQVSYRWSSVLSEAERRKVGRILGGNRYSLTARTLLDELFANIVDEHESREGMNENTDD